jgi:hypothetical protein
MKCCAAWFHKENKIFFPQKNEAVQSNFETASFIYEWLRR